MEETPHQQEVLEEIKVVRRGLGGKRGRYSVRDVWLQDLASAPEDEWVMWRSMFDESCRARMLARLRILRPDAPRQWGRMTAPQMIAHLTDQMHHALGDCPVQARPGPLRWPLLRYAIIYLLPWPKGRIQGPAEAFVTQPTSWEADVAGLEVLVERFVSRGPNAEWPDHVFFGRMSGADWGVFVHRHFDHHFRQFGV